MISLKIKKLAEILVNYSIGVKRGEHVKITLIDNGLPLLQEVYKLCIQRGAHVCTEIINTEIEKIFYKYSDSKQLTYFPDYFLMMSDWIDCGITINGPSNTAYLSDINPDKISIRGKAGKLNSKKTREKRSVSCNFPCEALANDAGMSLKAYENFYYGATIINYNVISKNQDKIKKILDHGKNVRIIGNNTDISFSIKGHKALKGDGHVDIPDGEVYITPDKNSAQGHITFEFPAIFKGNEVSGIYLEFHKGIVKKALAKSNKRFLDSRLNVDEGSKRLGEFGIGTNYMIKKFTKDILCDEKIGGTIHLALGNAYTGGNTANKSAVHWDLIKDMRKGGAIEIDGKLFQKNGRFL
ncbi:MAG: aminopeptidase [bacterium]